ncbi:hypothetical protein [Barrientosiimonas endolithica]|uniref:hypothetical protein n=1 Tax=Barrientosiimonas endolithica TaxID=1535208 RepID=UPI00259B4EEA|nr:hypothetical protein [Barrientosiimonas endolithica]
MTQQSSTSPPRSGQPPLRKGESAGLGVPFVGLVVVAGLLFSAMAAMFGGAAAPIELSDAGPVVRWGIPCCGWCTTWPRR